MLSPSPPYSRRLSVPSARRPPSPAVQRKKQRSPWLSPGSPQPGSSGVRVAVGVNGSRSGDCSEEALGRVGPAQVRENRASRGARLRQAVGSGPATTCSVAGAFSESGSGSLLGLTISEPHTGAVLGRGARADPRSGPVRGGAQGLGLGHGGCLSCWVRPARALLGPEDGGAQWRSVRAATLGRQGITPGVGGWRWGRAEPARALRPRKVQAAPSSLQHLCSHPGPAWFSSGTKSAGSGARWGVDPPRKDGGLGISCWG